jgi:hypothetical protein
MLNAFYTTISRNRVKIEARGYRPELQDNRKTHAVFAYGEFRNGVFKYSFSGVGAALFDEFLESHIRAETNLCCYLDPQENSLFAFNLDCYEKLDAVDENPEIRAFAAVVSEILRRLGVRPLIIRSGHGYHFWCRLSEPVDNRRLRAFTDAVVDVAVFRMTAQKIGIDRLQCICYPRVNTQDISIRLFGSRHTVTGRFSGVVEEPGENGAVLGEEESWRYFERFLNGPFLDPSQFERALTCAGELASLIKL